MEDKVIVTTNEGKVEGIKKISSFSGTEYYSFLGVPYAQPPVGNARFKDPVKVKPWKSILDATTEKEGCRQFSPLKRKLAGSEDCLYNNIHTTTLPSNDESSKPVIVNLHPGGFTFGSPDPSFAGSPEYVMHNDVVFVGISYRLHILGFLNLGLKECSGNQALKDIICSLKWIKENIRHFNGNPDNVTLLGSSSGSALVHALLFSPQAKGLFQKAVLMGTSILNPTLVTQNENVTTALEIARSMGYVGLGTSDESGRKKLLSFYKNVPIDAIIALIARTQSSIYENAVPVFPISPFHPTPDLESENSVLPYSFDNVTKLSTETSLAIEVPIMIGFGDKEAAAAFTKPLKNLTAKHFYTTIRQNCWGWGRNLSDEQLKQIQRKIEDFYLDGKSVESAPFTIKCNILTDIALSDIYDTLINRITADQSSTAYVYRFEYEGSIGTLKDHILKLMDEPIEGTTHGCDYCYWCMMKDQYVKKEFVLTPKTRQVIEKFTKLICTFAETGNPNYKSFDVEWKPSTVENPSYLCINDPFKIMHEKFNGERMEFWLRLKRLYRNGQL